MTSVASDDSVASDGLSGLWWPLMALVTSNGLTSQLSLMILKIEFLAKNKLLQQCVQILAQIPLKSPCLKDSRIQIHVKLP